MPVSVIGVTGAKCLGDVAVILAALILVAYQQRNRRAGGFAFIHAGENFHRVGFAALRDVARSAGFATVEVMLDVGFAQHQPGRAAIDHAADRRAVRLTERSDAE